MNKQDQTDPPGEAKSKRGTHACLQVIWLLGLCTLAFALICVLVASATDVLDEKRNIAVAKINPGITPNSAVSTKIAEYKMWFSGLYDDTNSNTSTAAYLRYTMDNDDGSDGLNFLEERANFMFPEHLQTTAYKVQTVEKEALSDWQRHVLHVSPEAFTHDETEKAQENVSFTDAYQHDDSRPLVKRTVLRKHKAESLPPGSGLINGNTYIANKESEFSNIRNEFPQSPDGFAREIGLQKFESILGKSTTEDLSTELKKLYFTHDESRNVSNTTNGTTTYTTVTTAYFVWFIEVDMYEKVVPGCDIASTDCDKCYRPVKDVKSGNLSALTSDELKTCRQNFNLLMGLDTRMNAYFEQCNRDERLPTIVWPLYAWTLNTLTLPGKYLTDMTGKEKVADNKKIMVELKAVRDSDLKTSTAFSEDVVFKTKDEKIDISTLSKEDRELIAFGEAKVTLADKTEYRICLVEEVSQSTLQEQGQCVKDEESLRYMFKHFLVVTLLIFLLIYVVVFLGGGAALNLNKLRVPEKIDTDILQRPFVLQYATDFRRKCELYAVGIKYRNWEKYSTSPTMLNFALILLGPLFVILASLLGFVIVLIWTLTLNNGIGPTCNFEIDVYTAEGLEHQKYIELFLVPFFLWSGWIFVVFLIIGIGIAMRYNEQKILETGFVPSDALYVPIQTYTRQSSLA